MKPETADKKKMMICSFIDPESDTKNPPPPPLPTFTTRKKPSNKHLMRRLRKQSKVCFACSFEGSCLRSDQLTFTPIKLRHRRSTKKIFFITGSSLLVLFTSLLLQIHCNAFGSVVVQAAQTQFSAQTEQRYSVILTIFDPLFIWTFFSLIITFFALLLTNSLKESEAHWRKEEKEYMSSIHHELISEKGVGLEGRIMKNKNKYATVLSSAIQIPTISYDEKEKNDLSQILKLHELLKNSFPLLHERYPPELINKYSLLFKIQGCNKSLTPIMFCSHLDVVPAPNPDNIWTYHPFSGKIIDGVIWGRGAIDNKHNIVGQLGAVEELLSIGQPITRTLYIAIGHDEEIMGFNGASKIAEHLVKNNITFEYILDEGPMMVRQALPGVNEPLAMIGNMEKGNITVEMSVRGPGGHSSVPKIKEENLASIMGKAVTKISQNPMPPHFEKENSFRTLFEYVADRLKFPLNVICSNLWIFGPLLKNILLISSDGAAASLRTTSAVTKIYGGTKLNVLPNEVKAYINHRVHPLDTKESVLEFDKKVVNDKRVQFRILESLTLEPSPISSVKTKSFRTIQSAVETVYSVPSAPAIMIGNTDTRWYWNLSKNIYRFSPIRISVHDLSMFHGVNERIEVDSLAEMVLFYAVLIRMSGDENMPSVNL